EAPAYETVGELQANLDILHHSLTGNGSETLARGRLRGLRRAVDVFGFHLAAVDLRQNSDVHEHTLGELLEMARPGTGYATLAEDARIALLLDELKRRGRSQVRFSPIPPRRRPSWRSCAQQQNCSSNTA